MPARASGSRWRVLLCRSARSLTRACARSGGSSGWPGRAGTRPIGHC